MPDNGELKAKEHILPFSELYDLCAPAVYGKILSIVHKGPIADKILRQVFVEAFKNQATLTGNLRGPLMTLLNSSREKSYKTIKALNLLNACCDGTSVVINKK